MVATVHPNNILIVTVTEVEARAVLEVFSPENTWSRLNIGNKIYHFLGVHGNVPTYMVQSEMGSVTPGGSLPTVSDGIKDLNPQAIIMCGIAFGLRPDKQALGDILIAKQLGSYESQKVDRDKGKIYRGDIVTASERLLNYFRSCDLDWQGPKRHFGLILSGEKLINDPEFRQWLLSNYPEAIGGEMEGAGLYTAARQAKVDWILLKAICDWADGAKKDDAQPLAALNAAKFLLHVIECGGWNEPAQRKEMIARTYTGKDSKDSIFTANLVHISDSSSQYMLGMMIKEIINGGEACQDALSRIKEIEPEADGNLHQALRQELLRTIKDQDRSVNERAEAGNALSELGDPRFRSDAWYLPDEDYLGFIEIPAGSFLMGTAEGAARSISTRECPQHFVDLPTYYIGRYPVTVAQYRLYLEERHHGQLTNDKLASQGNHPAVHINWHEALQYCEWLTAHLRTWSDTPNFFENLLRSPGEGSTWIVTLPSEAEWEKAARGTNDAREYPWGLNNDPNRANYRESGLVSTSAVGCFEQGCSPYNLQDMSGNVREWTRSNWGSMLESPQYRYPYVANDGREDIHSPNHIFRVLRGGSFYDPSDNIRCSCRKAEHPQIRHDHVGFRLVITLAK